jgi:hypothetical protein
MKWEFEDVSADAPVHNRVATLKHGQYDVYGDQPSVAPTLVNTQRRFRSAGTGFDENATVGKVPVSKISNSTCKDSLSIKAEESLGDAALVFIGPVGGPGLLAFLPICRRRPHCGALTDHLLTYPGLR